MRVAAVITDLMLYSRIESAASAAGASLIRVDSPSDLPDDLDLILVDWSSRAPHWAEDLASRTEQVILFGRHTDLESHAAARTAGIGPMWARSKLVKQLPMLMDSLGPATDVDGSTDGESSSPPGVRTEPSLVSSPVLEPQPREDACAGPDEVDGHIDRR